MAQNKITTKEDALKKIEQLDEKVLIKIAKLSENKKAMSYFTNPILFAALEKFLK